MGPCRSHTGRGRTGTPEHWNTGAPSHPGELGELERCRDHDTERCCNFDRFGGGLVETFCRSIVSNDKLLGVLCIDVAHSEKSVIDKLTELDAFDVSIVQIDPPAQSAKHAADDGDDGDLPKPEIHLCNAMRPELCPPRLSAARISAADLTQFAWLYYLNRLAGPHELRKGGVYSNGCQKARDCKFGVTVYSGMKGDVPFWDVAVIQLLRPQARDYLALLACALSLMSGIASLTLGYRKKTRVREAYFVRGLALGAIHVGADDQVVGDNAGHGPRGRERGRGQTQHPGDRSRRRARSPDRQGHLDPGDPRHDDRPTPWLQATRRADRAARR